MDIDKDIKRVVLLLTTGSIFMALTILAIAFGISFGIVSLLVWLVCLLTNVIPNFPFPIGFSWGLAGLVWCIWLVFSIAKKHF